LRFNLLSFIEKSDLNNSVPRGRLSTIFKKNTVNRCAFSGGNKNKMGLIKNWYTPAWPSRRA